MVHRFPRKSTNSRWPDPAAEIHPGLAPLGCRPRPHFRPYLSAAGGMTVPFTNAIEPGFHVLHPTSLISECNLKTIDLKSTKACNVQMPKRNPVFVAFGQNVRKRRDSKAITQEVLAEKADLDRTYISDIERGARNVSMLSMLRIAKALGTTVSELTRGIEK
jgi:DNA-binding XRE family transcriptional regulator